MEQQLKLPKKLLRIEDLTFELPDDFEGDVQSALELLVHYLHDIFGDREINPIKDERIIPTIFEDKNNRKVTMKYGIFERGEDGQYHLK